MAYTLSVQSHVPTSGTPVYLDDILKDIKAAFALSAQFESFQGNVVKSRVVVTPNREGLDTCMREFEAQLTALQLAVEAGQIRINPAAKAELLSEIEAVDSAQVTPSIVFARRQLKAAIEGPRAGASASSSGERYYTSPKKRALWADNHRDFEAVQLDIAAAKVLCQRYHDFRKELRGLKISLRLGNVTEGFTLDLQWAFGKYQQMSAHAKKQTLLDVFNKHFPETMRILRILESLAEHADPKTTLADLVTSYGQAYVDAQEEALFLYFESDKSAKKALVETLRAFLRYQKSDPTTKRLFFEAYEAHDLFHNESRLRVATQMASFEGAAAEPARTRRTAAASLGGDVDSDAEMEAAIAELRALSSDTSHSASSSSSSSGSDSSIGSDYSSSDSESGSPLRPAVRSWGSAQFKPAGRKVSAAKSKAPVRAKKAAPPKRSTSSQAQAAGAGQALLDSSDQVDLVLMAGMLYFDPDSYPRKPGTTNSTKYSGVDQHKCYRYVFRAQCVGVKTETIVNRLGKFISLDRVALQNFIKYENGTWKPLFSGGIKPNRKMTPVGQKVFDAHLPRLPQDPQDGEIVVVGLSAARLVATLIEATPSALRATLREHIQRLMPQRAVEKSSAAGAPAPKMDARRDAPATVAAAFAPEAPVGDSAAQRRTPSQTGVKRSHSGAEEADNQADAAAVHGDDGAAPDSPLGQAVGRPSALKRARTADADAGATSADAKALVPIASPVAASSAVVFASQAGLFSPGLVDAHRLKDETEQARRQADADMAEAARIRAQANALKAQLQSPDPQLEQLRSQAAAQLQAEQAKAQAERERAQAERERAQAERERAQAELAQLQQQAAAQAQERQQLLAFLSGNGGAPAGLGNGAADADMPDAAAGRGLGGPGQG
jgi:hypothetical protein